MITFEHVSVQYAGAPTPSLHDVTLEVPEGELVLVVGPTGSGKSTLLRTINGLVPHFSGGTLTGRVTVDGLDTAEHRPRDLATVVGLVEQNPSSTFVTDVVEDEVAYGMETMGLDSTTIRRRVEETLDLFGLTPLRARSLRTLSGGQQQRVAIAALFAAGPRVLVLDEPTSALDPVAAEEVLASLHRIVHDLGVTVVLAEHRLERVVHHADRVVLVDDGARVRAARPRRGDAALADLPARRGALTPRRMVADPPVDPGRPPQGGRPARRPRRQHAAPRGRPARHRARRRRAALRRPGRRAAAGSCSTVSTSTWPAGR